MPYKSNEDLPDQIKDNLPDHAQQIWREAFENAEAEYHDPDKRRDPDEDAETVAAKVAWSAVKNVYEKRDGEWRKKQD